MKLTLQILIFTVLPVLVLVFGLVPLNLRGFVLALVVLGAVGLAIYEKMPLKELGFRTDNLKRSLIPYGVFTLVSALGLIGLANLLGIQPIANWWTNSHLQWAFLPISAAQEFGYRAYFQTKLQKKINPYLAIFIMATLYSGMHILWRNPLIMAMTFVGGIAWGYLWYKYPNFYLLTISHSILNFLAIFLGFFPWLVTEFFNLS